MPLPAAYFGLLSIGPEALTQPELVVPNQTARHLLHAFLRDAYRDVGAFTVYLSDLERLMRRMAQHGASMGNGGRRWTFWRKR